MQNLLNYVQTELRSFTKKPLGEVDSLVLSQLSYIHLDGFVPSALPQEPVCIRDLLKSEQFPRMLGGVRASDQNRALLMELAASPRFRDIRLVFCANEFDAADVEQFSAVTCLLDDRHAYLAFRGTDSTVVGWKEDFNLSFMDAVPAQQDALCYLERLASALPGTLFVGGHSKGGNLAVYAAANASSAVQGRIAAVFSHDGPGFRPGVIESDGYAAVSGRIRKTVPQSSMIGMLLENHETYTVVKSAAVGIMQHDPFSWEVCGGEFLPMPALSGGAQHVDRAVNAWISGMSDAERALFTDTFFGILEAAGVKKTSDLARMTPKQLAAAVAEIKSIDPQTRRFLGELLRSLVSLAVRGD